MDLLAEVSIRSLFLFLVATAAMCLLRVNSASTRHAVLTSVTAGMLLLPVLHPILPQMPLRILKAESPLIVIADTAVETRIAATPQAEPIPQTAMWKPSWPESLSILYLTIAAAFLLRLVFGYILTRRLVARAIPATNEFLESADLTTPVTVGWIRPKILLPTTWRTWEAPKLRAVLAHEQAHIARADWPVAALAGMNRSLFWFHPLAWWLERRLSALAEQACDDSALLAVGDREQYAQTLLDMAAAQRGLVSRAIPMAGRANVTHRIDRILDDTRIIPRGLSRMRRAAIAACSVPILCVIAALQLAPPEAKAQAAQVTIPADDDPYVRWLLEGNQLTYPDVYRLEGELTGNPQLLAARGKLVAHYYQQGLREPRLTHIWWLIEHRPESELTGFASAGVSPRPSSLNTLADYERTRALWKRAIARFPKDTLILSNAVQFFAQQGGDSEEAERLIKRGRALEPQNEAWTRRLGSLYASLMIAGATEAAQAYSGPGRVNKAVAARVRTEVEKAWTPELLPKLDRALLHDVYLRLAAFEQRTARFPLLRDSPEIRLLVEFTQRLRRTHHPSGAQFAMYSSYDQEPPQTGPRPAPRLRKIRFVSGFRDSDLRKPVQPVYPALAREQGIEGTVRFRVTFGRDGHVRELQLLDGHPLLVASARAAVSDWTHKPRSILGEPIEVEGDVEIRFELAEPTV